MLYAPPIIIALAYPVAAADRGEKGEGEGVEKLSKVY